MWLHYVKLSLVTPPNRRRPRLSYTIQSVVSDEENPKDDCTKDDFLCGLDFNLQVMESDDDGLFTAEDTTIVFPYF